MIYEVLTDRERIGFEWELRCQQSLSKSNIDFTGNPSNPIDWKKDIAKGYDISIRINGRRLIAVECKFLNNNVYLSYVHRDWYPRFMDNAVYEPFKVFLVNNKLNIPDHVKEHIEDRDYEIMELGQLIDFTLKIQKQLHSSVSYYNIIFLLPSSLQNSVLRDHIHPFVKTKGGMMYENG